MSINIKKPVTKEKYRLARLSRDARFDGHFFVAVKTTKIYCRPICPANTPKENNIEYYQHAHLASAAGYRPCLRCHPDSAPNSPIWKGVSTTLERAKRLIDNGALSQQNLDELSSRLGISDRYLRQLFDEHLGISPKAYALFKQCEFAKQLLHQTSLPVTEIALASGFKSVRRFNDCFKKQLKLTPTQVRKSQKKTSNKLVLKLYYRPPYNWDHLQRFFAARLIEKLEWCDEHSYGRTFTWISKQEECKGWFTAHHNAKNNRFDVTLEIDNLTMLKPVVNNIRRILDLDTDTETIEECLQSIGLTNLEIGLRLPGTWSVFEAGIRAILGQQISVVAARKLVKAVIDNLGDESDSRAYFPSFKRIAESDLEFIKMPGKRKETLRSLAKHFIDSNHSNEPDSWLAIKGIGPWTVDYAKMRGLSDPDIYLGGDLGVQKGVKKAMEATGSIFKPESASPFRSYLTFQIWNLL